ncbi:ankyrin repeat domain-containing protein [Stenotrophomonas bentonitica]|uniref:ankyrin repeat domain-containing protein n=1 Tax=Stenotrophomonas bentonitica TaxID=1450134 RepID=UPI0031BB0514
MNTPASPSITQLLDTFEPEAWASPPTSIIAHHVQHTLGEGDHHPAQVLQAAVAFLHRSVEGVDGFGDLTWIAGPAEQGWPWVKLELDYDGEKAELLMLGHITPESVDTALHDERNEGISGIVLDYLDEQLDEQDRADTLAAIAMDGVAFRERQHHAEHLQQTCGRQAFLEEALQTGDERVLNAALALGAAVNAPRLGGNTALHQAIENGHSGLVALLLDAGAWRESFNHAGMTPLHLASAKGDTESCLRLIATGVEVSLSDFQGRSPVSLAKAKVKPDLSL